MLGLHPLWGRVRKVFANSWQSVAKFEEGEKKLNKCFPNFVCNIVCALTRPKSLQKYSTPRQFTLISTVVKLAEKIKFSSN